MGIPNVTRQTNQIAMLVHQSDIAFSSQPISYEAKRSNMLAWTVRSWRIVGSGGGMIRDTRNRRALPAKLRLIKQNQRLVVYEWKLIQADLLALSEKHRHPRLNRITLDAICLVFG
ncbi:hypothetical protein [Phyllobacterium salinisoli]|uniref:hypothetical protein n=1 Tax=Phyllobacterium salinisoli TaxID=1899321 RepID=UPI00190FAB17|nr:hypothetical protein [Phyllobacterium salinisoli]